MKKMLISLTASFVLVCSMLTSLGAGTLNVAINNQPNLEPMIPGSAPGQTVYLITFDAMGSDEDVKVTSMPLGLRVQNGCQPDFMVNWSLFDPEVGQLSTMAATLPYTYNFGNMLIITQGTVKTLVLKCDILSDAHGEFAVNLGSPITCVGITSGNAVEVTPVATTLAFIQILGLPSINRGKLDFTITSGMGSFVIHGTTGYRYQIEESYDLINWHVLGDMVTAASTNTALWLPVGTNAHAFYRFRESLPCQLTFEADASTPYVQMVAAGSANVTLSVFKFSASYEDMSLTSVGLHINGDPACIERLSLWDGNTQIGYGYFPASTNMFVPLTHFTIPKNASKTLTIKADLSSIGISEALTVSGHQVGVAIDDSNPDRTVGIGMDSGRVIQACGDGRTPGGAWVFKSFPTFTLETLPSTGMMDGRLLQFKVSANVSGSISIHMIALWINFQGATIQNINLYNLATGEKFSATNFNGSPGVLNMYAQTPIVISAGATYFFELRGEVQVTNQFAWMGSQLLGDCCNGCGGLIDTANNVEQCGGGALIWSPNSFGISSLADPDWKNAEGIEGLPSSSSIRTP
ncbi:MAG: hypothetical protein NTZ87_01585 [Candidatus Nomurabacteria bacterium]|nr:hypothetical protein [Candidatus Nomurabacteria bacterium]